MQTNNADKHVLNMITKFFAARGIAEGEAQKQAEAKLNDALLLFHAEFAKALGAESNDPRRMLAAMKAATAVVEAWMKDNL